MEITLATESPDQPEAGAFFAASEAYMAALYPAESNHFVDVAALLRPDVHFVVARRQGMAVGCGALVRGEGGSAEIKRMWVDPNCRGGGVGGMLLANLVDAADAAGVTLLQLETGINQPEAISLYRRAGFVECGPFGNYSADPLSVFMELALLR